jgi:hypothetical protein
MTASELTKWAIAMLNLYGDTVWRNNNLAVKGRKFIGRKGVPDIIGYDREGRSVWCEVKTKTDRLSEDQEDFLNEAHKAGCRCYIARFDKSAILQSWADYKMLRDTKGDYP